MNCTNKGYLRGFTLIELMVVVIIIGVLAAISYPSYLKWTTESRRSDAFNALSRMANDLEKFYSECSTYPKDITTATRSCTAPAGPPAGSLGRGANGDLSPNQYYQLAISATGEAGYTGPTGGYVITATARGKQANDTTCRTIALDSTGKGTAKNSSNADSTTLCWKK